MRKYMILFLTGLLIHNISFSQAPKRYSSDDIYEALEKLNFLGTALYIAAHPDDENTRLISYISNEVNARTAYLSVTRGDGGQNLIGQELRELLGVLRTEELLSARNIDGGEQFFTRANDFGFSKHPDETLELWNKKEVLADVVWAIRKFRPDIVINRFDHRTAGSTHGHHTSSAILSVEAFDLAGNKNSYPDQLSLVNTWQPKRLFFNTSWWFYGSPENFDKADKTNMLSFDVGTYFPYKGLSNNEIAALSRSRHSSQGFGSPGSRGGETEYLEFLKGEFPTDKSELFAGINTSWSRVEGGKEIGDILYKVQQEFDFRQPSRHIPDLVKAYTLIRKLKDDYWKDLKSREIINIITACGGIYLEAVADSPYANPGGNIKLKLEAINRSDIPVKLNSIILKPSNERIELDQQLAKNVDRKFDATAGIANDQNYTTPYWLLQKSSLGMYKVDDQQLIGKPESPRALSAIFELLIDNVRIPVNKDIVYKHTDPSKGEIYQPFEILPEVTAGIENKVNIFSEDTPGALAVKVRAGRSDLKGSVSLELPKGWKASPESIEFSISQKGDERLLQFMVTPPKNESEGIVRPSVRINGSTYALELTEIEYDHVPKISVLMPSEARVVRLNIQKAGENIGYIVGAGDEVPESLKQIGYNVITIKPEDINDVSLSRFDAVVLGIRAYNVVDALKFKQQFLLDYVKNGGNLIVQYNTSNRGGGLDFNNLAPYKLEISRDRVTDENSEVELIATDHSLLNFPNKIEKSDFDGWVQERGLYFPDSWGEEFTPILSMHDKNESPKQGSLLVAPYGKGHYIYTGLSFFRELPAGVPGAYKLFSNMLSIGKAQVEKKEKIKG